MEVSSSSYSQLLSLQNHLPPPLRRRVSAKFSNCRCRSLLSISSGYGSPSQSTPTSSSTCSTSTTCSSFFGESISVSKSNLNLNSKRRCLSIVCGVFERFTERAIKAVMFSQKEAKSLGQNMVYTQHLLLGLIAEDKSPLGFLGSGITIDKAREAVREIWNDEVDQQNNVEEESKLSSSSSATDVPFSVSTKRVFEAAVEYSKNMGYHFIAPEHIAIGLFTVDDGNAGRVLKRLGVNANHLATVAVSRLQGELAKDGRDPPPTTSKRARDKTAPGKITIDRSSEKSRDKSALAQFCVDLTARASDGLIDPVIGRETEVQRIVQILCRRTKCNPILLGEAGVGKTAIAEGLAINIVEGNVPEFLLTKRIMSLDIGLLISGAKERGELEGRVTTLIKEIKESGKVVLFIDEVHTLIGSGTVGRGNKGSGLDIGNLLKPSLGRGEIQVKIS